MFDIVIFLSVALIFISILILLVTTDNLYKDHKKWYKRLTRKGKIVVSLNMIAMVISFYLLTLNNAREKKNQASIKRQDQISDSIAEIKYKKMLNLISNSFADQELEIDTLNNTITRLKNPTVVSNYTLNEEEPLIFIKDGNITLDTIIKGRATLRIRISSLNATSSNFDILALLYLQFKYDFDVVYQYQLFPRHNILKNGFWETTLYIENYKNLEDLYIYMDGTYTNLLATKTFPINVLHRVYVTDLSVHYPVKSISEEVISKIKSLPVIQAKYK